MLSQIQPSYISSFDGTRLAVYDVGKPKGPTVLLINGLGGNLATWKHIVGNFEDRIRFISFDYRGMYKSKAPANKDYSMETHAKDALAVLEYFGVGEVLVMGWSMGVQVCLEFYRLAAARVIGLILANGAYGKPLDKGFPGMKKLGLLSMDLLAVAAPLLRPFLVKPLTSSKLPVKAAKLSGFVSEKLDEEVFVPLARDFMQLDFVNYRECVRSLVEHDAEHVLGRISVPTLIISGGRDLFTPAHISEEMVERIPNAELLHIRDASHYGAVEYPELINTRISNFLRDRLHFLS
jgi:pimeloyl-ACP methyl ester carboxylesterase